MDRTHFRRKPVIGIFLLALLSFASTNCSSSLQETQGGAATAQEQASGRYYVFEDVLVPIDLNYEAGDSFVYETPEFKAGTMVFSKWWYDPVSVIDFFTYHMEKDGWRVVNSFKGRDTVLNFSKPDKACMIKIWETWYNTVKVEIRVGPLGGKRM
jgi:hypothetical protein